MEKEIETLKNVELKAKFRNSTRDGRGYWTVIFGKDDGTEVKMNSFDGDNNTNCVGQWDAGSKLDVDFTRSGNYMNIYTVRPANMTVPAGTQVVNMTPKAVAKATKNESYTEYNEKKVKDIRVQNAINGLSRVYMGTGIEPKEFADKVRMFMNELYTEDGN